ncbi:hypothetical protein [Burkholderia sp. WSM2232]|uniref:hypothetical protein n=1 Tax=Burkholderia sp. WSM2232 TaxID=944436 RepID=UPI0004159921|nr:hypothetical protein [Burkholderia sp. WSM2232]
MQSSTQCKYWNHPPGWRELVAFLKEHGYRVICIDQKATLVYDGGTRNVLSGGSASIYTKVRTGGTQNVMSGGTAYATLLFGGVQNMYDGASTSLTFVSSAPRRTY